MNSKQTEQLHAYFDDELSPTDRETVEAWLTTDESARAELESLRKLREQLRSADVSTPDVEAQWQDLQTLRNTRENDSSGALIPFPRLAGVAALLLIGLVVWFANVSKESEAPMFAQETSNAVELVESDFEDSSPIVFMDDLSGWIVIWVEEEEIIEPIGKLKGSNVKSKDFTTTLT